MSKRKGRKAIGSAVEAMAQQIARGRGSLAHIKRTHQKWVNNLLGTMAKVVKRVEAIRKAKNVKKR